MFARFAVETGILSAIQKQPNLPQRTSLMVKSGIHSHLCMLENLLWTSSYAEECKELFSEEW